MRMGEGFPVGTRVVEAGGDDEDEEAAQAGQMKRLIGSTLNQRRARRAVDPPRTIPNRVVKRRSAEGTGG